MKRLAIVASLFVFAACAPKAEKSAAEGSAMAAPAMSDSTGSDSTHNMKMMTDSTGSKSDSSTMKKKM